MPDSDRVFIQRATRVGIILAAALFGILALLWVLKSALTPLVAAFVIAYLFDPLIDRFEERRVPRSVAIVLLLVTIGAGVLGFLLFLIPVMQRELSSLATNLPGYVEGVSNTVLPWLEERLGVAAPEAIDAALERLRSGDFPLPLDVLRSLLAHVASVASGTVGALVGILVVPVISFYFLVDFDILKTRMLDAVPLPYQAYVAEKARVIDTLLSGFIRGQLTVCLLLGLLYALGFAAIGIDLAVVIGFSAGALAIVPYLGNAVALTAASGMALIEYGLGAQLLLVFAWYGFVQALEGTILTPRIVGRSLGMHPVTVIVALLIGGDLLGFLGLLVAIPVAAVVQVFFAELRGLYRASRLYQDGGVSIPDA